MSVILLLMGASLLVALAFLAWFIWAVRSGQFDDTGTPAMRILMEDEEAPGRRGGGQPEAAVQGKRERETR